MTNISRLAGSRINIRVIKIIFHNNFNVFVVEIIYYFSCIRGNIEYYQSSE